MADIVYESLSPLGYSTLRGFKPDFRDKQHVIMYRYYNRAPALFGDGKAKAYRGSLQIYLLSKENNDELERQIIKILTDKGFIYEDADDGEIDSGASTTMHTGTYILRNIIFNYLESEVIHNNGCL